MIEVQPNVTNRERHITTSSIAIRLRFDSKSNGLVLVNTGGQWGLPAGGLDPNEYLIDGVRRELGEETGIDPGKVVFAHTHPTDHICIPGTDKTRIGHIFDAVYHGPRLNRDGWIISGDSVSIAKPFSMRELLALLRSQIPYLESPDGPMYKHAFNFPALLAYIVRSSHGVDYINDFLRNIGVIEGLSFDSGLLEDSGRWFYSPRCLEGMQDPEAVLRRHGRKWGK